jgi:type III pantothenate kinase
VLLAVDIGNTSIHLGGFKDRLLHRDRWPVSDQRKWVLSDWCSPKETVVAVASVNPPVCEQLVSRFSSASFRKLILLGRDVEVPVRREIRRPEEVGIDRLLNAHAAFARVGGAAIVVDFGTATTFDIVSAQGAYIGGAIAPGLGLSARALGTFTALLPKIELEEPAEPIGKDTVSCIRIGILAGYCGLVDRLLDRFTQALPDVPRVLATGGEAHLVAPHCRRIEEIVPDLTLEGIFRVVRNPTS